MSSFYFVSVCPPFPTLSIALRSNGQFVHDDINKIDIFLRLQPNGFTCFDTLLYWYITLIELSIYIYTSIKAGPI